MAVVTATVGSHAQCSEERRNRIVGKIRWEVVKLLLFTESDQLLSRESSGKRWVRELLKISSHSLHQ